MLQEGRVLAHNRCRFVPFCLALLLAFFGCREPQMVDPAPWPTSPSLLPPPTQTYTPPRPTVRPPTSLFPWRPLSAPRPWRYIVLHHTASDSGSVESIDAQHRQRHDSSGRPWKGIGYHFVIGNGDGMGDGEIAPTFRWTQQMQGAHAGNAEYNERGIGVVLVGNFEQSRPSMRQRAAARRLVLALRRQYRITADRVVAHRDVRNTKCPGKFFPVNEIAGRTPAPYLTNVTGMLPRPSADRY